MPALVQGCKQCPSSAEAAEDVYKRQKEEDVTFIRDFYTRALVSTLVQWLESGITLSPETMIERIDVAMNGAVLAALQRSSERT